MQNPLENTLRTHKPSENMLSVMSNMPRIMLQACILRSREGKHVEKQQPRQQFLKRKTVIILTTCYFHTSCHVKLCIHQDYK